jgi:hypothetical protein
MRVPIGVVKEGERDPEHWISIGGTTLDEYIRYPVAIDSNNNTYNSGSHNNYSGILVKHDKFGALQYSATTRQAESNFEGSYGMVIDSSNNLYRVNSGFSDNPLPSRGLKYVTKYNTSLQPQFSVRVVTSNPLLYFGDLGSINVDSQGNFFVGGQTYPNTNASSDGEMYIAKFNSSGSLLWQRRFGDNRPTSEPQPGTVFTEYYSTSDSATDSSNNAYVVGYGNYNSFPGNPLGTTILLKYDPSGNFQWKKRFDSPVQTESLFPTSIVIDQQNNLYIGLNGYAPESGYRGILIKTDSSGNIQWQRSIASGGIASLAISSDSYIYVSQDYQDGLLISKFDTSAQLQWQLNFQGQEPSGMGNSGVAISQNGTMYVNSTIFSTLIPQYRYFNASLPSDGSIYGSYLLGPIRLNIFKVQTNPTPSNIIEASLVTTSAVAGNTVVSLGNPQATPVTFDTYRVIT